MNDTMVEAEYDFDQETEKANDYMEDTFDDFQDDAAAQFIREAESTGTAPARPTHSTADKIASIIGIPTVTPAEQVKALLEQVASISKAAIDDLKAELLRVHQRYNHELQEREAWYKSEQERITRELAALGVDSTPNWAKLKAPKAKAASATKKATTTGTVHCKYCNIDGHDARKHVGQRRRGEKPKKFTAAEMKELGLI